ncbi:MAG: hypothetical protein J5518_00060 [Lachnospiraceae bacterium]|nr:hypothetical protein [Lachnospiraceae bacterium]
MAFIGVFALMFNYATWIFRTNVNDDVVGLENEGDLDVLWLGGSVAAHYFQPLQAYHDYGYCAYDFGSNACRTDFYINELAYARRIQDFDLYIVDLRTLALLSEEVRDIEIGSWTSQLGVFSFNRFDSMYRYYSKRRLEDGIDWTSIVFDIARTHSNTKALADERQWDILYGKRQTETRGFETAIQHTAFEKPNVATTERRTLTDHQREVFTDLLDYCKNKKMQVLFIVNPYIVSKEEWETYNSAADLIDVYGFDYLNTNEYVDEMGIDFETDFENMNHVNYLGSVKFHKWFSKYLKEHYDLPDHRVDPEYSFWEDDYERFKKNQEDLTSQITELVESHLEAKETGLSLSQMDDTTEWLSAIKNDNYTIVLAASDIIDDDGMLDLFSDWEIQPGENYVGVWEGNSKIYVGQSNETEEYEGLFSASSPIPQQSYGAYAGDDGTAISVNGIVQDLPPGQIKVVVFDVNYQRVWDSVALVQENNRGFTLYR